MGMQRVSRGYPLSNMGFTQRCADQMVVVGEREGQPKFSSGDRTWTTATGKLPPATARRTVKPGAMWTYLL